MKNFRNIFLMLVAASLGFASCSDDDNDAKGGFGNKPVRFSTNLTNYSQTRVSGDAWDAGDAIGVYMVSNGKLLNQDTPLADNVKHTTSGSGEFIAAIAANSIKFPASGSVDFVAYYPHADNITGFAYPVDVADQSSPAEIDFMYSNNAKGLNKTSNDVMLNFEHMLSKLIIKVTEDTGNPLAGLKVTVKGMNTKGSFSLVDGAFTPQSGSQADIAANISTTGVSTADATAIILPVNAPAGATVTFEVPTTNRIYTWDVPATSNFLSKNSYTFKITLKSDGTIVVVAPEGGITDWNPNENPGEIELNPDGEIAGAGTQADPYYVSQVAEKAGETAWVKGFVVGVYNDGSRALTGTGIFEAPFNDDSNILIAQSATENDLANCVVLYLADAGIKSALNLKDNGTLLGKEVKVKGLIGADAITNITEQEGGIAGGGEDPGGEEVEFFNETFGTGTHTSATTRPKIAAFDGFDMRAPFVFSDSFGRADIRNTATSNKSPHVWLPGETTTGTGAELKIEGIEAGYTKMKLTFDILSDEKSNNMNMVKVYASVNNSEEQELTMPSETFGGTTDDFWVTVNLDMPDGTTEVRFYYYDSTPIKKGFRLDNIIMKGTK